MRRLKTFMFSFHRVIGTIICLFLLMWFISGLVLLYHPFHDVSKSEIYEHMDVLPDSLPCIGTIISEFPISEKDIKNINVSYFQDQVLFQIKTKDSTYAISEDNKYLRKPITETTILSIAKNWNTSPISKIDTLYDREIWIMYSRYENEMPIYKLYFNDDQNHELYISSRTGEVLQFTNKEQRFWAWVGSIPHKFYIPALRKNTELWIQSLTIGGVIALLAGISGIVLGIYVTIKRYRKKQKITSPYTKKWYKWHHVLGLIFGLFVITFAFSGAMALQKIPQWIIKTHGDYRVPESKLRGKQLSLNNYVLTYNALKTNFPEIKQIEWSYFQNIPIYNIVSGNKSISIDASTSQIKELNLSESDIEIAITKLYKNTSYKISKIDEYEEYYLSRNKTLPLPVFKVEIDNLDESSFYINPKDASFKYVNKTNRAKKWVFSGLHYLNIKYLIEHPTLWTLLIWTICIGGGFVSLSGVYLGFKYIRRKIKHLYKHQK